MAGNNLEISLKAEEEKIRVMIVLLHSRFWFLVFGFWFLLFSFWFLVFGF